MGWHGGWGAGAVVAAVVTAVGLLATAASWRPHAVDPSNNPSARALATSAACAHYSGLPEGFGQKPLAGMVAVPAGDYEPGSTDGYPDERPAGRTHVAAFWIDRTEVTNAQFAAFVAATGHVTGAEREGGSAVFRGAKRGEVAESDSWWVYVKGADWRHPEGPGSDLHGRGNQPVVHVTLADAAAYARWLGRELPSEAQWEWAARGGGDSERIERAGLEPRAADGRPVANYWQGVFPDINTLDDGYASRAPVGCYPPNGYGLHDLIGNVWEWTRDVYRGPRQPHGHGLRSPRDVLPEQVSAGTAMVIKGGSFLCASDYCARFRSAARHPQEADLGVAHVGFRTVSRGH